MTQVLAFRPPDVIAFEHKFFASFDTAHFRLDETDALPVFTFELGQQQVSLPFSGIKREFVIPEYSADAVMLNTVAHALRFVSLLQLGDRIPPEVLTGDASWEPDHHHHEAARRRISAHLVGWDSGKEVPVADPVSLEKFVNDHVTDEAIRYALLHLGAELGHGADGANILSERLDTMTNEFAYIEALRERYFAVRRVGDRLRRLRRDFAHLASMIGEVDPVLRLISIPIRSMGAAFIEVDARLTGIVSLFANFDMHRKAVRDVRDDLHCRLKPWKEITDSWRHVSGSVIDPYAVTPLLRDLYRFLAPRFMPVDNWALMLSKDSTLDENRTYGSVVTWYDRKDEVA